MGLIRQWVSLDERFYGPLKTLFNVRWDDRALAFLRKIAVHFQPDIVLLFREWPLRGQVGDVTLGLFELLLGECPDRPGGHDLAPAQHGVLPLTGEFLVLYEVGEVAFR